MASSKARSRNRPPSGKNGRAAASKAPNASRTGGGSSSRSARPQQVAVQTAAPASQPKAQASRASRQPVEVAPEPVRPAGPPLWLQVVTLVLALCGLGVSIYETWAHFNGSHLLGCPTGTGTFNCTAVITSSQSMVFGVIPVAVLGLVFYVFVVAIMSPWAWRIQRREVGWLRLAAMVVGMGFVVYLIYAELQIGSICEYCTGVHIITFLLFCITVVSAAIWGLGAPKKAS
jgi:uncharacterized membrane protein